MLDALGVTEQDERVYVALLDRLSASPDQLATTLGLAAPTVNRSLTRLRKLGLVTRLSSSPTRYLAAPPDIAVAGLLVERQAALQQARARLAELIATYRTAVSGRRPSDLIEVLASATAVRQALDSIQRAARAEMLFFVQLPYAVDGNGVEFETLARGVRYRCVYERLLLEQPRAHALISAHLAAGEQIRVGSRLPFRFAVADRDTALVPLLPDQPDIEPGYVLVRSQALVAALVALFEQVWERATPLRLTSSGQVEADVPRLDDVDVQLLRLMLSGMPDKAVASQLGTSLRTVQRRVRQLMEATGATNRLQLGSYLARTDLI